MGGQLSSRRRSRAVIDAFFIRNQAGGGARGGGGDARPLKPMADGPPAGGAGPGCLTGVGRGLSPRGSALEGEQHHGSTWVNFL